MISLEIEVMCNVCMINKDNLIKCNNCVFNMCDECFLIYVKDKKNCPHCNIIIPENLLENTESSNIIIYPNNKKKEAFFMYCLCFIFFCFFLWLSWCIFYIKYMNNFDYTNDNTTIYNNTS